MVEHLPRKTQVGPKPREGDHPMVYRFRKQAGGRRLIEIEPETMPSVQGEELPEQIKGIVFSARTLSNRGPAGINADEHLVPYTEPIS